MSKYDQPMFSLQSNKMPFGLQHWNVIDNDETVLLNLNACNSSEFGCNNGVCIPRYTRCNQEENCEDGEDEALCSQILIPRGYSNLVPLASHTSTLKLMFKIILIDMLNLDFVKSTFTLQFHTDIEWMDERLR